MRGIMTEAHDTANIDPAPMQGLASLPVFFDLNGRRALLAGGSPAAAWKAELLQATGARVDAYSPAPSPEMKALAQRAPTITLIDRLWREEDFDGAAIAIGDFASIEEAVKFQATARRARVPVNVVDKPDFSDFQFGTIIDRSPLVIAISTRGAAPVFALALRGRFEGLLPQTIKLWAQAAQNWRAKLKRTDLSPLRRRRFWELFVARSLGTRAPRDKDYDEILALAAALTDAAGKSKGSVALVGAGPGDPELITMKGLRMLQAADVVLFDDLVAPAIVEMARREAIKIGVGKRGYQPSCRQDDIIARLVSLAKEGKRVVRLKGGDPSVFGRSNEEITALEAAGIEVEVIPGVTAALGAAASLRLSLTERDHARRLQFITAHARDGRLPQDLDWAAICDPSAATAVYMGVRTLPDLMKRLLEHGIDPQIPALLVESATWPNERRIHATVASLADQVATAKPSGPCLVLIGNIFGERASHAPEAEAKARIRGSEITKSEHHDRGARKS
jgi:uroporphyrin-III C-methyltransferase/precorrin-2 dehydrogenase/sirohydrochlorin ferrochelatase